MPRIKKVLVQVTWELDGETKTQTIEYGEGLEISAEISQSNGFLRGYNGPLDQTAMFKRTGESAFNLSLKIRNPELVAECEEWKKGRFDVREEAPPNVR